MNDDKIAKIQTAGHDLPVPPKSLDKAIAHVRAGGRLYIATATRITIIDKKALARFEAVNEWLLKEDGNGYRIRRGGRGKGSDYLFPGQLMMEAQ
jgi:hypothetical protein